MKRQSELMHSKGRELLLDPVKSSYWFTAMNYYIHLINILVIVNVIWSAWSAGLCVAFCTMHHIKKILCWIIFKNEVNEIGWNSRHTFLIRTHLIGLTTVEVERSTANPPGGVKENLAITERRQFIQSSCDLSRITSKTIPDHAISMVPYWYFHPSNR